VLLRNDVYEKALKEHNCVKKAIVDKVSKNTAEMTFMGQSDQ
jgi:hypothetical protein